MYKCRYTFWDEKHFPGFTKALSDLYDRSINNYYKEKHDSKNRRRDLNAIYDVFPLIEYYYVSLIKLGFVDKKNYFNILNQLKSIESIGLLKPGAVRGLTIGNKIQINPEQQPMDDLTSSEMFDLETSLVTAMNREVILKTYLNQVKDNYDYILIDSTPSLGMMNLNALSAADSVIIPVQAQYLPAKCMTQLLKTVSKLFKNLYTSDVLAFCFLFTPITLDKLVNSCAPA